MMTNARVTAVLQSTHGRELTLTYKDGTPLANLHLTLLDRVGVRLDAFGDSNGKIEDLFVPAM